MGGLDLYMAREDTIAHTWEVKHLPAPMNSNGDDFGITFEGLHNRGFSLQIVLRVDVDGIKSMNSLILKCFRL